MFQCSKPSASSFLAIIYYAHVCIYTLSIFMTKGNFQLRAEGDIVCGTLSFHNTQITVIVNNLLLLSLYQIHQNSRGGKSLNNYTLFLYFT